MSNITPRSRDLGLVLVLAGALTSGCSNKIDAAQAQNVRGLIYKLHDTEPFTGTVTNVPRFQLPAVAGAGSTCVVEVRDGRFHGKASCQTDSGQKTIEQNWEQGKRDGVEKVWDAETGRLHIQAEWKNGQLEGSYEVRNPRVDKLIDSMKYSKGEIVQRKAWDVTGEHLLVDITIKNGNATGITKSGEQERNVVDGQMHGVQRQYSLEHAGKSISDFLAGERLIERLKGGANFAGLYPGARVASESVYERGVEVSRKENGKEVRIPLTAEERRACLDGYASLHRRTVGPDAPVNFDQIREWQSRCDAGQKPS